VRRVQCLSPSEQTRSHSFRLGPRK
jgi:hypothetical protein